MEKCIFKRIVNPNILLLTHGFTHGSLMQRLCFLVLKYVRVVQAHGSASWQVCVCVCVYARMFFPCFLKACIRDYIRPKAARNSCHHVASASRRPHETDTGTQHCNLATAAETRSRGVCLCTSVCGAV